MNSTHASSQSINSSPSLGGHGDALVRLVLDRVASLHASAADFEVRIARLSDSPVATRKAARQLEALAHLEAILSDADDDLEGWWKNGKRASGFDFRLPLDLAVRIANFQSGRRRAALPPAVHHQAQDLAISLLFLLSAAVARSGNDNLRRHAAEFQSMIAEAEASLELYDLLSQPGGTGRASLAVA